MTEDPIKVFDAFVAKWVEVAPYAREALDIDAQKVREVITARLVQLAVKRVLDQLADQ